MLWAPMWDGANASSSSHRYDSLLACLMSWNPQQEEPRRGPRTRTEGGNSPPHCLGPSRFRDGYRQRFCVCIVDHGVIARKALMQQQLAIRGALHSGVAFYAAPTAVRMVMGWEPWRERPRMGAMNASRAPPRGRSRHGSPVWVRVWSSGRGRSGNSCSARRTSVMTSCASFS